DGVGAHGRHDLPAGFSGDFLPAPRAVENNVPVPGLLGADARHRVGHQGGVDASGLQLRTGDAEIGVDDGDVLAEVDALGDGVDLDHLKLRAAHVDRQLLALEIGQRLDGGVFGED